MLPERATDARPNSLLDCLQRNDAELLLSRFWDGDADWMVAWYRIRFPQLREKGRSGRDLEVVKAGGEAGVGDGGTVLFSKSAKEAGSPLVDRVAIGAGEFGLVVPRRTHLWTVIAGGLELAALLALCDGTRSVDVLAGGRGVKVVTQALLWMTLADALTWSGRAGIAGESPLRKALAEIGAEKRAAGMLTKVVGCFLGE